MMKSKEGRKEGRKEERRKRERKHDGLETWDEIERPTEEPIDGTKYIKGYGGSRKGSRDALLE